MGRTNVAKLNGKINITLMSVINGYVYNVSHTINLPIIQSFVHKKEHRNRNHKEHSILLKEHTLY